MTLIIFLLNFFLWQIAGEKMFFKRKLLPSNSLFSSIVSFFISYSIIGLIYLLFLVEYLSFWCFLSFLTLVSFYLVQKFNLKNFMRVRFSKLNLNRQFVFVLFCLLIISLIFIKKAYKWGGWDSFAIWSQHARFLVDKHYWRNYLSNDIPWCHPDYPLMLSSYIAIIWRSIGIFSGVIPSMIAYLTLIAIPLSVYSFFKTENKLWAGMLFFILISIDFKFIEIVSWLNADTLLALFYLLSFMLFIYCEKNSNTLYLLGFYVASCGWIKNEGNLFFLVFSFCLLFTKYNRLSSIFRYLLGAIIPLSIICIFKLIYAPVNDIVGGQSNQTFVKIFDLSRYLRISEYFLFQFYTNYKLIIFCIIIAGILASSYFKSFSFAVLIGVLAGYFFIYVITPNDLEWHLFTSCERLIHQLYPSFIFTIFASFKEDVGENINNGLKAIKVFIYRSTTALNSRNS